MNILKPLLIATTLSFVTLTSAQANTPSDASLTRLASIMPYEGLFAEAVFAPLELERERLIYLVTQDTALSDTQRKDALKAFDDYAQKLVKQFDNPAKKEQLKKAYIDSAKQRFTQAEVDAMLAFYGSEVGKSALNKEAAVYDAFLKSVEKDTLATLESYQKANDLALEDAIKRILNK